MSVDFELTPLQKEMIDAIQFGNAARVEDCLSRGAGTYFTAGYSDEKPMHVAAVRGHAHILRLLVEKGAPVDDMDMQGHTPLLHAAERGHLEAVQALIELGAAVDHVAHTSRTALCQAAMYGHDDIIRALLAAGADPNIATERSAPLFFAVAHGRFGAAKILVEGGARVDAVNDYGETAAKFALREQDKWRDGALLASFLAAVQVGEKASAGAEEAVQVIRPLRFKPR